MSQFSNDRSTKTVVLMFLFIATCPLLSVPNLANTWYAQPGASACPCGTTDPLCGTSINPYACLGDAVNSTNTQPGDTVIARDGTYNECITINKSGTSDTARITIAADHPGLAIVSAPASCAGNTFVVPATYVTLRDLKVTAATPCCEIINVTGNSNNFENLEIYGGFYGVILYSSNNRLTNNFIHDNTIVGFGLKIVGSNNTISGGRISANTFGVIITNPLPYPPPPYPQSPPSNNTLSEIEIDHNTPYDGVDINEGMNNAVTRCHVHHNNGQGIGEHATQTLIEFSEIDNNGIDTSFTHGIYAGGSSGTIRGNKIHHNGDLGIHLWAAPQGTPSQHYIVEKNDVYGNSHGIVLGGPQSGPPWPVREIPQYVEIRYNLIHHNLNSGFAYQLTQCNAEDVGNSFHHNTVYLNAAGPQIVFINAVGEKILVKNNIVVGSLLARADWSNLAPNAMDGNMYFYAGATADSQLFQWNGYALYSFNQIHSGGVWQNANCEHLPNPLNAAMDTHSTWSTNLLFVDPSMSLWNTQYAGQLQSGRHGDFHLRFGSDGRTEGVCCQGANGGSDIDDETPAPCTPDCSGPGDGVGADFYNDTNANEIADKFDLCQPPETGICDGDGVGSSSEQSMCAAYPGASYDPAVCPACPGVSEICDGKDNTCDGSFFAGGESDGDADGFFSGCGGDCNDSDARVYPGALAFCDSKINDCNNPSVDTCDLMDVAPGGQSVGPGTIVSGTVADLSFGSANNTYVKFDEGATNPKRLTVVWTFRPTYSTTTRAYDLVLEGMHDPQPPNGNERSFRFTYATLSTPGALCSSVASNAWSPIVLLSAEKRADDGIIQKGRICPPGAYPLTCPSSAVAVFCVRAQDEQQASDTKTDRLTLDRLYLFLSGTVPAEVVAAAEPGGTGTLTAGTSFLDTLSSGDVREGIKETTSSPFLAWTWRFDNVPPGLLHQLHLEGYETNLDTQGADAFQFSFAWGSPSGYTDIAGASISTANEVQGGADYSFGGWTDAWNTLYIKVQKVGNGNKLDTLNIDHVAIKTVPF